MSITVLADENIPAVSHFLGAAATVSCVSGRALGREQLKGIDALLVRSITRVDEQLLSGSSIQFVGTATSGFDHIDRDYLARSGIGFAYAPGSNANSVVEYVLAAIARTGSTLEVLLRGEATVGIAGYGVVGRALGARLEALGIRFRAFDPWLDQNTIANRASLAEVLDCEVVSVHAELTVKQPWPSRHLLGEKELDDLRPGSLLINASRGAVVDNAALLKRLESRNDVSVVLDVWEGEPSINPALLEKIKLGSAHIAGYSLDGKIKATRMLCDALAAQLGWPVASLQSPLAEAEPVVLPAGLPDGELVRQLLYARYDISLDDKLLRELMVPAPAEVDRAKGFDRLRKQYRERRELAGARVFVKGMSSQQAALIAALDCVVESSGSGR